MTAAEFFDWLRCPATERRTLLMGILNLTPDSFSDGGQYCDPAAALDRLSALQAAGADLIDIGAESTRPGSQRIDAQIQIARLKPLLDQLPGTSVALSIDTTRAAVASYAIDHGFCLVNDISAATDDPAMLALVAHRGVAIALMHMQGQPATMQIAPAYQDVVGEVKTFLLHRATEAQRAGIPSSNILIDPGIGFGKTVEQNLSLFKNLSALAQLSHPLLVGPSRKRFVGHVSGENDASGRLFGTAACVAWCVAHGATIVRIHDVSEMSAVLKMTRAILAGL